MMRPPRNPGEASARTRRLEMLLFLAVSAVGVYALGSGIRAITQPGGAAGLVWLAVAGAAMWVLFAQMGRVHDTWPRRPNAERLPTPHSGSATHPKTADPASGTRTDGTGEPS